MLTGAFVSTTKQENEFKKVTGLAERFVILLFAFYIELKKTLGIKEKLQAATAPHCLSAFLSSRWLSLPLCPKTGFQWT